MNIGIVVEGSYDSATYPIIIHKIRPDCQVVFKRFCGGGVKTKFVRFLKECDARKDIAIERVLVIRDSDCNEPGPLEEALRTAYELSRLKPRFSVEFYVTRCELESLLLADESAINRVARSRGRTAAIDRVEYECEVLKDAKELFWRTLTKAGLRATKQVYARIAEEADIQIVRERCPYFREFISRLHSD